MQGLSAPFLSSDCVGGLLRELSIHASKGDFKVREKERDRVREGLLYLQG